MPVAMRDSGDGVRTPFVTDAATGDPQRDLPPNGANGVPHHSHLDRVSAGRSDVIKYRGDKVS
jgi:hypothetical protein